MKSNLQFSIVIPCFNYAGYVDSAIQSALSQTYKNFEVIVVDDGSTDNSVDIIKRYRDQIVLVEQENAGPSAARNAGIARATGNFILPLDADDVISNRFLEDAMSLLTDPKTIISPIVFFTDDNLNLIGETWPHPENNEPNFVMSDLLRENRAATASIFSKEMWAAVGGYDTSFRGIEDYDFWINMVAHGCQIKYLRTHEPYFFYRKHPGSLYSEFLNNNDDQRTRLRCKYEGLNE